MNDELNCMASEWNWTRSQNFSLSSNCSDTDSFPFDLVIISEFNSCKLDSKSAANANEYQQNPTWNDVIKKYAKEQ